MRNKTLAALAGLLLAGLATGWARGEVIEQIVAQVNNDIITLTQYNTEKQNLLKQMSGRYQGEELTARYTVAVKQILPTLINELLLIQKANEYGMSEDLDLEANAFLEDLMKQNSIPTLEALKQEMARAGIDYKDYYESLKRQILVSRIRGAIVRQRIKVMTGEVEKYYQDHIQDFTVPEQLELAEIVLYTKDKNPAEVRARIDQVHQELQAGQSFAELAKAFSEGPSAQEGGNIGTFAVSNLAPAIREVVQSLQPGQHSRVLEMDFGFEILQLVKRTAALQRPLDEVRREVEDQLFRTRLDPVMKEFLEELRKQSYVYVFPEFRGDYDPGAEAGKAK
jgi:peptidyl-prolyl cis-trans isomerase SurA